MQGEFTVVECDRCKAKIIGFMSEDRKIKAHCNCCGCSNEIQALTKRTYRQSFLIRFYRACPYPNKGRNQRYKAVRRVQIHKFLRLR